MAKAKNDTWVRWSDDEVKLLRRLFPKGRAREIAERTGRPLKAVRQKAYTLGLKTSQWRRWSDSEVKLLGMKLRHQRWLWLICPLCKEY